MKKYLVLLMLLSKSVACDQDQDEERIQRFMVQADWSEKRKQSNARFFEEVEAKAKVSDELDFSWCEIRHTELKKKNDPMKFCGWLRGLCKRG